MLAMLSYKKLFRKFKLSKYINRRRKIISGKSEQETGDTEHSNTYAGRKESFDNMNVLNVSINTATSSQSSLKDLIEIAEMEMLQEKNDLFIDDHCEYEDAVSKEELSYESSYDYEEMRFNSTQNNSLYMTMTFQR